MNDSTHDGYYVVVASHHEPLQLVNRITKTKAAKIVLIGDDERLRTLIGEAGLDVEVRPADAQVPKDGFVFPCLTGLQVQGHPYDGLSRWSMDI